MELKVAPKLLAQLDLEGMVVTLDALHTQRKTARQIIGQGGDYFMVVKDNQPDLLDDIKALFEYPVPEEEFATSVTRGRHGDRFEERSLKASDALNEYLNWPHVGQVCQIERRVTRKGQTRVEVNYAVTSLKPEKANATRLQRLWRGHWGIENRLHWERDVVLGEDVSQVRKGAAPQVMAALRNLALGLLRQAQTENIAAALRRHSRHPHEALALMGWDASMVK